MLARFRIHPRGDGGRGYHVEVNGEDIGEAVTGVEIHIAPPDRPLVTMHVVYDVDVTLGVANLVITEPVAIALRELGWVDPDRVTEPPP